MTHRQWDASSIAKLYDLPLNDLLFKAQEIHRQHFPDNEMELCTLLSVKTGACPEDCSYCSQSGHYQTHLSREKLLDLNAVILKAKEAKEMGSTRFCMGAAWRNPPKKDFPMVLEMIKTVKEMGLETCVTLGMLDDEQAKLLKEAGLDYYNHNLDTSPDFYKKIISTRTYQERLDTLNRAKNAGLHLCCGGIFGMGETRVDRIALLLQLTQLPLPPKSVPINQLIPIKGTPLEAAKPLDKFEFVRTIAVTRILLPASRVRLSAGRTAMTEEMQALCFVAGANSMWFGGKLLTAKNPAWEEDRLMLQKLGMPIKKSNA